MVQRRIILLLICVTFFTYSGLAPKKCLLFGHRGASYHAPENTLGAIKKAFELGADGVEVDIQMTADKKLVVLHDETLERTATYTCQNVKDDAYISKKRFTQIVQTPICELHYDDFKHIDVGLWKGIEWAKEKVPKLDEVLCFLFFSEKPGKKIQIEIKSENFEIISELTKILAKYPSDFLQESVTIIGFDLEIMRKTKQEIPICCTLLVRGHEQLNTLHDVLISIAQMEHAGLDGIDLEANPLLVTKEVIKEVKKRGKTIGIWVYPEQDTPENLLYFTQLGVDFQTTNLTPAITKALKRLYLRGKEAQEHRSGPL